jgi:hypothetical protein
MRVVNIIGLMPDGTYTSIKIDDVPDTYIPCSVSGEYLPRVEFSKHRDGSITMTNCYRTYEMTPEEMEVVRNHKNEIFKSKLYSNLASGLKEDGSFMGDSISVQDLIAQLQKLKPTDRVCIQQDGYYADGKYASIYDTPEFVCEQNPLFGDAKLYSIGYSSQHY